MALCTAGHHKDATDAFRDNAQAFEDVCCGPSIRRFAVRVTASEYWGLSADLVLYRTLSPVYQSEGSHSEGYLQDHSNRREFSPAPLLPHELYSFQRIISWDEQGVDACHKWSAYCDSVRVKLKLGGWCQLTPREVCKLQWTFQVVNTTLCVLSIGVQGGLFY